MSRRQFAALAVALLPMFSLGSAVAQEPARAQVVIVACAHGSAPELSTRVIGVETAGRVPERLVAALEAAANCATAYNALKRAGFELAHHATSAQGDFDGDGDVDGSDFTTWRDSIGRSAAQPSTRIATVLIKCDYVIADGFATRVAGSENAGPVSARLAAALAAGPSCAAAWTLLADAGLGLVSAKPAPAAVGISASDLELWQSHYGSSPP